MQEKHSHMIKTAEFVISNTKVNDCPAPTLPEYAFIGRSNVGKSSLINMLANNKKLAKTSGTPGKTQLINHFIVDKSWYLVDLPGYGYAKVSRTERARWETFIRQYFLERENLMCAFVLLDCRHEPQKPDLEFMNWLGEKGIPFVMTFTKMDKLSSGMLSKNIQAYTKEMLKHWDTLPQIVITSAENGFGQNEILDLITKTNPLFKAQ